MCANIVLTLDKLYFYTKAYFPGLPLFIHVPTN